MRKNRTPDSLSRAPAHSRRPLWPENKGSSLGAEKRPFFPEKQGDPFTDVAGPSPKSIRDPGSSRRCLRGPVPAHILPFRGRQSPRQRLTTAPPRFGPGSAQSPQARPRSTARSRYESRRTSPNKTRPDRFREFIPAIRKFPGPL